MNPALKHVERETGEPLLLESHRPTSKLVQQTTHLVLTSEDVFADFLTDADSAWMT